MLKHDYSRGSDQDRDHVDPRYDGQGGPQGRSGGEWVHDGAVPGQGGLGVGVVPVHSDGSQCQGGDID